MYFGDLYQNTDQRPALPLRRFPAGRNAFYKWIHDSLAANKPYNQMATELITATGANSYTQGELNWIVGRVITGGPQQDNIDSAGGQRRRNVSGHLPHELPAVPQRPRAPGPAEPVGRQTTPLPGVGLRLVPVAHHHHARPLRSHDRNTYYWAVHGQPRNQRLPRSSTTTGNRPARAARGRVANKPCYVPPMYIFTGETPKSGENYRVALARIVTSDLQFSRAAVNYMWAQFFGRGIVDPPNQFDPARLDPDNPPRRAVDAAALAMRACSTPWRSEFVDNGFDLKMLMRKIVNSRGLPASSRYNGEWNADWEPLFARKFVRRLWAEEIHDAVVQSSGMLPTYKVIAELQPFPAASLRRNPTFGHAVGHAVA